MMTVFHLRSLVSNQNQDQVIQMRSPRRRLRSQPHIKKKRRMLMQVHPSSAWASPCLASGRRGLDHELGVYGTTLQRFNQEHQNKLTYRQRCLLGLSLTTAQFLLHGPAQRSVSPPGLYAWDSQVRGPQLPQTNPIEPKWVIGSGQLYLLMGQDQWRLQGKGTSTAGNLGRGRAKSPTLIFP